MVRIVQKYGGTSVATIEHIKSVAKRIQSSYEKNNELIVVVSARAGITNELLRKAHSITRNPNCAELDSLLCVGELETIALLAIALNDLGIPAVSRNAYQVGVVTCSSFGNARIENILGGDVENCLQCKKVVIIAGFQGIDENLHPTTLGRGGSDLTAIALAHRFQADKCEIFTDVDGIFTADPRIIKSPYLINEISHDALLRLTFFDNKVMQDRSVALAKKMGVNFTIASSLNVCSDKYTSVIADLKCNESCVIGLTYKKDLTLFCGVSSEDIFCELLQFFSKNKIDISFIKHNVYPNDDQFLDEICIEKTEFSHVKEQFCLIFCEFYKKVNFSENLARIDIIGTSLEYSSWLDKVLTITYKNDIYRSEYGKNGLSFLTKNENHNTLMNELHSIIFD